MKSSHRHSPLVTLGIIMSFIAAGENCFQAKVSAEEQESLSQQEANEIAVEAYLYFYPLVTMEVTRKISTNIEAGQMIGRGPMNTLSLHYSLEI